MNEKALIVFAKRPGPGKVKTRLAKNVGFRQAADAYSLMLSATLDAASSIRADLFLYLPPGDILQGPLLKLAKGFTLHTQRGSDLGQRMKSAFEYVLGSRHLRAVLIGSDCPYITHELLREAFGALVTNDTVLGPARDGGYYLVGQRRPPRDLFSGIPWSTQSVFQKTIDRLNQRGWTYYILETLEDIDDSESYTRWLENS